LEVNFVKIRIELMKIYHTFMKKLYFYKSSIGKDLMLNQKKPYLNNLRHKFSTNLNYHFQ